uniref:Transporter n=1 Tax=Romanomermis culicivorax TaxID=13658 RepID=A0A915HKD8_ROMCU
MPNKDKAGVNLLNSKGNVVIVDNKDEGDFEIKTRISDDDIERGGWAGKFDFLMSLVAYAIGLGNVWRFPYLCYKNGGVCIGQFLGEGGISVWKLCPLFKGVGIANNIIASMCNIYYCVIVCWAMFYVLSTFAYSTLPWQTCQRSWNDIFCWDARENLSINILEQRNLTLEQVHTPVTQFWEKRVLKTSSGIDDFGGMQWELTILLAVVWILTYFALYKGITNSRKLVYICAITPYCLLAVLLIRGLTLDGASTGLMYLFKPDMQKLFKAEVWKDAGTQIFYSSGIGFGTLVALGSYNKYHHNVYKDAITLCVINSMTSLTAGCVVFSVLGYMASITEKTVDQVVKSGVGLAFLVYPEAISTLPISQLWSVLFFLMIMILGLDSQVCTVEGVVLSLCDQFPNVLRKNKKKFLALMCLGGFLLGLPMVSQSGQYWLTLVDAYGASGIALLFVVFFEIVGLSWGFGADRIYDALEDMLGKRICKFWFFCWKYSAPLSCV